ncbi:hypothetical protein GobsT_73750 [Gemmata obscuriglobus]|nr:hypothetical protein GobsT_73750 [Gemmata obscuriglobus]VTS11876.1 unnamed protein product [Gemmata obscuriglobus UQM 2246]
MARRAVGGLFPGTADVPSAAPGIRWLGGILVSHTPRAYQRTGRPRSQGTAGGAHSSGGGRGMWCRPVASLANADFIGSRTVNLLPLSGTL